ncbi:MAG: 4-(cytidine 5'-diphospho)-2-C-methyl-D-erythritol kinase [Candidatus Omnitrophota bacterium]|nr:4-(cytidine 5'-diphospho)-2-C-methyl-D-erythritol kinase [Candidatus Omnitrophota bacterium]
MLTINAPAKLNLYLKVLSEMTDGYHGIETLFERIDLCDKISIGIKNNSRNIVWCSDKNIPSGPQSLMGKCISLFKKASGCEKFFEIRIEKHIPVSAGLGGGSSDAAAVLKGLNSITNNPLSKKDLITIGKGLGADIPFFLHDHSFAFGRGRGDEIEPASATAKIAHILVNPPFGVSTKHIYDRVKALTLTNTKGVDKMFNVFLEKKDINAMAKNICNDLQPIALKEFPLLEKVFAEIREAGAKGVLLSGSGPTVFGIFDRAKIKKAKIYLEKIFRSRERWGVYETYTC